MHLWVAKLKDFQRPATGALFVERDLWKVHLAERKMEMMTNRMLCCRVFGLVVFIACGLGLPADTLQNCWGQDVLEDVALSEPQMLK